jgi:succinate-acetate transporter protein
MAVAFGIAVTMAISIITVKGVNPHSLGLALALTARWSFGLFWAAYVGSALPRLFGPAFNITRHGREFGLAFAAAHLVHIGLVIWLYLIAPEPPVSLGVAVFFSIGIFWTYLLAALSIERVAVAFGPATCGTLRIIGTNYILLAFLRDFVGGMLSAYDLRHIVTYLPFTLLGIVGPIIRLIAGVQAKTV